jgi:nicotinate-nucleotide adenylyltransferase
VGGTFDPIHLGHVAMAKAARSCADLDQVLVIPVRLPPHRSPPAASEADRLTMCELAVRGQPGLQVSDLELRRPGPSYTLQTLRDLHTTDPGSELFLVLGWDAARELRSWHRPEEVLRLATAVVVPRPGLPEPTPEDLRAAGLDPGRAVRCRIGTPDIRATEVRRRLQARETTDGLVDPAVLAYIREHHLYEGRD